jgi:hypothetical protein
MHKVKEGGLPDKSWIHGLRETNRVPAMGVQFIKIDLGCPITREDVDTFLQWIGSLLPEGTSYDLPLVLEELSDVSETPVKWFRARYRLYPLFLESLQIVNKDVPESESLPPGIIAEKDNVWLVSRAVFLSPKKHYRNNEPAWRKFVHSLVEREAATGGFSFNLLQVPFSALDGGGVEVRPLVLHALSADGAPCDRGDLAAQAAVANAFWQTFWATGALRAQRGKTFPVAFLPIDRSWTGEFEGIWHGRWVSLRRRLFGRTSLMAYMCEALTKGKSLWFDCEKLEFCIADSFDPQQAGLAWEDFGLCLYELNRTAFVDSYTGDNAKLFAKWKSAEQRQEANLPWNEDDALRNVAHALEKGRVDINSALRNLVRIHRVVPYAGCAFLSEVVHETARLKKRGKIRAFDDSIVAATNSTFFLNFPEEYVTLHSAMNDPVAVLVENGYTHQIKTLRRAAFVVTEDNDFFVTADVGVKLECEKLIFEGESVAATYAHKSDKPFSENRIGPLNFGAVIVGNSVVEVFEDSATEIPSNGWVVGDSEAFDGQIEPRGAASVTVCDPKTGQLKSIRHALGVGPLLVSRGEVVPLGASKEDFRPIMVKEEPSFEESAELPRTGLCKALYEAPQRGVPPTRFPYDWNVTRAPRTAIGVRPDGTVILVVVDGRARLTHSVGATLAELAQLMRNLGCQTAMNMDGGGSSVMFVNDAAVFGKKLADDLRDGVVSLPSDLGGVERLLPVPLVVVRKKTC